MYDKEYAQAWIKNYESGRDTFRADYLEPYLEKIISELPDTARILDVGCGWGTAIEFLKSTQEYHGIDIAPEFLSYIRKKYPLPNVSVSEGKLPRSIAVENETFDAVICSMVLHTVSDLHTSIETLFSKITSGGKAYIIDFNEQSEEGIRKTFSPIIKESDTMISGSALLPSGMFAIMGMYFHKEKNIEREIKKHGIGIKEYIGPLFVAYTCEKK